MSKEDLLELGIKAHINEIYLQLGKLYEGYFLGIADKDMFEKVSASLLLALKKTKEIE